MSSRDRRGSGGSRDTERAAGGATTAGPAGETVSFLADGPIGIVTIRRPEVHNAMDAVTRQLVSEAMDLVDSRPDLRVGIVTGEGGRAFSSGSDLKAATFTPGHDEPQRVTEDVLPEPRRTPFIAAIDGFCLGAGLELALQCDIRIASGSSTFGLPEPRTGTLAGYGLHALSLMIPPGEALYMQLTGMPVGADRALRSGLIQEIVGGDVVARARELAHEIVRCSPMAVAAIKRTVDFRIRSQLAPGYEFVRPLAEVVASSHDAHEGPAAFREKRPPRWTAT